MRNFLFHIGMGGGLYFNTQALRFGGSAVIKFEAHFILSECASDQNKCVNE